MFAMFFSHYPSFPLRESMYEGGITLGGNSTPGSATKGEHIFFSFVVMKGVADVNDVKNNVLNFCLEGIYFSFLGRAFV